MAKKSFSNETETSDRTSSLSQRQKKNNTKRLTKLNKQLKGLAYTKFKYKNLIYSLGEAVEIQNMGSDNTSIAIIKNIQHSSKLSKNKIWPMIEVEWLFTKQDIISLSYLTEASFLGSCEVFRSNAIDLIFIESIIRKVKLLNLDQYQTLEEVNDTIYFSRASIDIHKVRVYLN